MMAAITTSSEDGSGVHIVEVAAKPSGIGDQEHQRKSIYPMLQSVVGLGSTHPHEPVNASITTA